MSKPTKDEEALMELSRKALVDALGREPTRQELWRVHAGFKRMAFTLLEHLNHMQKYEDQDSDQTTYPEDIKPDQPETDDESGALGEKGEPLE